MTKWEREQEDQEQLEWLAEWRKTHRRWMVKIYDCTPSWDQCLEYYKMRYFTRRGVAEVYAAWMRLWYPKVEVEQEQ